MHGDGHRRRSSTGCRRTSRATSGRSREFDGTHALRARRSRAAAQHPDWGTLVFNLGRTEVRNFLLANALFWLREYHADGLRVDAVASMLYLDYSRKAGEWVPNEFGGREDLDAVVVPEGAERARARPRAGRRSRPPRSRRRGRASRARRTSAGSASGFKWNMGWMHDTLALLLSTIRSTAATTTTS